MRFLLVLLCFLAGCYTPLSNLKPYMAEKYHAPEHNTVSAITFHYFTEQARIEIKDIPCVDGATFGGSHAAGVNGWSILAAVLTGNGYARKCVMSIHALREWGPESVIHEYLHHLDDIGRDGGEEYINLDEFKNAYLRLYKDPKWKGYVIYTEKRANAWVPNTFGVGPMSEHIAYLGARLAMTQRGPNYLWDAFRKVLRKHGKKVSTKSR